MAIDPMHIRNSASDRERVETLLRRGFEDGRLSQVEFSERLERVHTTVDYADLVALVEDLPYDHAFLYQQVVPSVEPINQPVRRSRARSVLIAFFAFFILAGAAPMMGPLFIFAGLIFLLVALPRRHRRMIARDRYRYREGW
ncbi:MAG: DUF1707 SHOCT-like domain-containing protein [Ferrimicrobium sp.]|uniref:DUF1707 SHOCT-like domain-containing protein n=1 Tax=Ferrimicrobium sp. TaxID=2926050 RepID=UPI002608E4F7|nr:DUF1707 domain-containing protein [Ferrimicrobium sp.]